MSSNILITSDNLHRSDAFNAIVELVHKHKGRHDIIIACGMNFNPDLLDLQINLRYENRMDVYENEIPDLDKYSKEKRRKLIIFDNMVRHIRFTKAIHNWLVRGRMVGASIVIITQSYFDTNQFIRKSLSDLYLFPSSNYRELNIIRRDYPFLDEHEEVINEYRHIKKTDGPSDFLNISVQNATACINFDLYDK